MDEEQKPEQCPACADFRRHTIREWKDFHPWAGHGIMDGQPTAPNLPVVVQAPERHAPR